MTARPVLELRAAVRKRVRDLFDDLGFVEVDTPVLSREVLPEAHIDPIAVPLDGGPARFLQASPEALMKRLLAAGSGPIYQLARSFRAGERGHQHDVEFVLLEWYSPHTTLADAADLLARLCERALGTQGIVADWREPDIIRVAPVPLYNSHQDVVRLLAALVAALAAPAA